MKLPLALASALTILPAVWLPVKSAPQQPAPQKEPDKSGGALDGTYACQGTRPDGAEYRGVVRIVHHNGTYQLLWTVGQDEQYLGVGMVTGNVLSVSYFGGTTGLVVYRIEQGDKGPRLVGTWTVPEGDGQVSSEILTRVTTATSNEKELLIPEPQPRSHPVWSRNLRPA